MNNERESDQGESQESIIELFEREIHQALSPTWAKSTQELLPGYLPNKPRGEYTQEELVLYQSAYGLLGEMVKRGEVEVTFDKEVQALIPDNPLESETIATPRFKLVTHSGKKSPKHEVLWQGGLVADS